MYSDNHVAVLLKVYDDLANAYPKSSAVRRVPLDFLPAGRVCWIMSFCRCISVFHKDDDNPNVNPARFEGALNTPVEERPFPYR